MRATAGNLWCNRCGYTYLMALMMVMVMGILLAMAGQSWQQRMQREKEEELLFRGSQMQDALSRWHQPAGGLHVATPLIDLKHLLRDPRTAGKVRHLRRLYADPMTGREWELIRDPVRGIIGVKSASDLKPYKMDNFPAQLQGLINKTSYREWLFVAQTTVAEPGGQCVAPEPIGMGVRSGQQ
jgi:type II secretory pathway pseudopilin PulG